MIEEIKNLRIKIDGLAQLTRNLRPQYLYKLDLAKLPDGMSADDFVRIFKETGFAIEDSFNQSFRILKDNKLAGTIIESIPQIHKEVEKATDSLYLAKAWLGKMLQELGEQTPYTNDGKRKDVNDIEVASDKSELTPGLTEPFNPQKQSLNNSVDTWALNGRAMTDYDMKSHIEKVDWLREEIKEVIETTSDFSENHDYIELEQGFVYKYLCEARFWLGFELQRIKENESSK